MIEQFKISERGQYDGFKSNGREHPLIDPNFDIEINLRKEIQNELFGDEDKLGNRHVLFLWLWERKPHICEESGTFLGYAMQAEFMSHILTRGAHVEMWNDPRNINILSPDAHRKWETGKREKMRIWKKNKETIALLKSDYSKLKTYRKFEDRICEIKSAGEIYDMLCEKYLTSLDRREIVIKACEEFHKQFKN